MKNIGDIFNEKQNRFTEGRSVLAKLQLLFDARFGEKNCLVAVAKESLVVHVASAALALEVQMQKHTIVQEIATIEPLIRRVRISIGIPKEPKEASSTKTTR